MGSNWAGTCGSTGTEVSTPVHGHAGDAGSGQRAAGSTLMNVGTDDLRFSLRTFEEMKIGHKNAMCLIGRRKRTPGPGERVRPVVRVLVVARSGQDMLTVRIPSSLYVKKERRKNLSGGFNSAFGTCLWREQTCKYQVLVASFPKSH